VRVLVVEDDAKLARFLVRMLVEEGFVADACHEGAEAIERAQADIYDLMLLDWMLPDLDGVTVCKRLREAGCTLPILMLTARGQLAERVLGLRSGADDYLVKPFEIDELLARIEALARRANRARTLAVGPVAIDQFDRRVTLAGAPLDLTERERSLLTHLALRKGQVVSRADILTRVWGLGFDPDSNLIEVHISRLRDKLGDHASLIETVRGRGYRLRESEPS
jgi:DNA-binding response OmpR family regulator